jgi:ribose/xylose/arabinose/galactoside ABC-type transport system permease subunit
VLNAKSLGLALGAVAAACMLICAWIAALTGWGVDMIKIAATCYLGYSASFLGGIIGALWGFAKGFILGWLIAWAYNKFNK